MGFLAYRHTLIKKLSQLKTSDPELAQLLMEQVSPTRDGVPLGGGSEPSFLLRISPPFQIYENAMIAAGLVDDPRPMVGRLNNLLVKVFEGR